MTYYNDQLKKGKADELLVVEKLAEAGYKLIQPTKEQDRMEDIDIIIDLGNQKEYVSIKSQQAGIKYGQIYFELKQKVKPQYREKFGVTARNSWVDSNHIRGKHTIYAIYQGDKIFLFYRDTVDKYVAEHGWLHTKTLSRYRKEALESMPGYYYCDSKCGFLKNDVLNYFQVLEVK